MISVHESGSFNNIDRVLKKCANLRFGRELNEIGESMTSQLRSNTPKETGATASKWNYRISKSGSGTEIAFINPSFNAGFNIVQGLRYGHGTGSGGYVSPNDFVSPIFATLTSTKLDSMIRSAIK